RGAYPYEKLARDEFNQVLEMLSEGVETRRSRRSAYIHRDRVNGMLRPRRGARLTAITNGGAIPDTADYNVIEFPNETFVGTVNEDFAIESLAGDIFLLGNRSWRIRRVASGKVWVEDAQGLPPSIPFWMGEAPARTFELSKAVADLRVAVAERLPDKDAATQWLIDEITIPQAAAEQIVSYVADTVGMLGTVPSQAKIIAERFFDEAGGMQLILHSPWGGRINRAWGLALRKRFCVSFDRELQAAATDDGICISLVEQHSFPLSEVFLMLRASIAEDNLTQAALASPMFTNRWRWNATRALALTRFSGGKKVAVAVQRMRAEDLLAAVFPEQVMCQDNRSGPVELPDHPLVKETMGDCLHEAMDLDGLKDILTRIENGTIQTLAIDTPAPSPMAHEILNANPYAFLDDAPLEERRARAVSLRRVDPWLGREFGHLDAAAITEVCRQAWPEVRAVDELHDMLLGVCLLPFGLRSDWRSMADALIGSHRATVATWTTGDGEFRAYVAAERSDLLRVAIPTISFSPPVELPLGFQELAENEEDALKKIVQGWLEVSGPVNAAGLSSRLGISVSKINAALIALENSGVVMRGQFTDQAARANGEEWCDRVLLARIHRLTLGRMRKEIEPVSAAEFMNFLLAWQHVTLERKLRGREGVLRVIEQLQGLELPAPAWEQQVLPARVEQYDPADLEHLCLSGVVAWGRLRSEGDCASPTTADIGKRKRPRRLLAPARNAPIAFLLRDELDWFLEAQTLRYEQMQTLSPMALEVARYLERHGASFLADIARGTGILKVKVEEALWQLVAHGLATGDGIAGLRVLLTPEHKRVERRRLRLISGGRSAERAMPVGRWSLWRQPRVGAEIRTEALIERHARQLLERYGIVFRELLVRESKLPPWRSLLGIFRRLEARGEIRGGRFVNGFVGEQFALASAVEMLRANRRQEAAQQIPMIVGAADPLNLVGIVSPGARLSAYSNQAIAYQNGVPLDVGLIGELISRLQNLPRPQRG
ncbi:MAG TPA: DEAD/DEAH box helicase, partial [Acidobacteriota bacterium]|nr:DEAD/DEAH box helicase [Acidobacteriota bacterium]